MLEWHCLRHRGKEKWGEEWPARPWKKWRTHLDCSAGRQQLPVIEFSGGWRIQWDLHIEREIKKSARAFFFLFSPNSINHLAGVSHKVWHNSVQVHVCVCEEVSFKPESETNNPYAQVEWNVISQTLRLAGGERWESTAPLGTSECRLSRKNVPRRRPADIQRRRLGLESTGGVLHNRSKTFKSHSTNSRSNIIICVFACVHCCRFS